MGPWIFGTCSSNTPIIANRRCVYTQVWGALFPKNEGVPEENYDFIAVWTLYFVYQPYWVCRSKVYLVHKAHIPPAVELKIAYMAKFGVPSFPQTSASLWQIMILWQFGPCSVCSSHIGSVGSRDIWYTQLIYPLLWNEKSRTWPTLGCFVPTIEGVPVKDYDFMAALTPNCLYHPYWIHGSKGYLVHIAHIPALLWNKNRVHCLFWDAVIPTNEGIPAADYDFVAACTLYCMYKPYWVCGSKANWYTQLLYPCCRMKNRVYGQVWGALVATIEGIPVADYDFMVVWTAYCMYQPYWVGGSKGYLVHIAHIPAFLWNQNRVYGLVSDAVVPTNKVVPVADDDFMAVWALYWMYQPYWVCGSKGYLVRTTHIPTAIEWKIAYMAKFGVPSFPQSRASMWQIMILWQFVRHQTVCTSHIRSKGPRAIWYIKLIYPLLWN